MRSNRPWAPRETIPVTAPPPPPPQFPGIATIREADLGLKDIAKRAALEAEKAVLKEVLDRVRWNRAEAARLLKISYKALLYKITAAGLDGKVDRRSRKK
jgi:DNA-binding NtrC family response regulator